MQNNIRRSDRRIPVILIIFGIFSLASAVSATTLTVGSAEVSAVGDTATIDIMLDSVPAGLSGYSINVTIADPAAATITAVSYPSWAAMIQTSTLPSTDCKIRATDLDEVVQAGATDITLATLTLQGLDGRSTPVTARVNLMNDDDDNVLSPAIVAGTFAVAFPPAADFTADTTRPETGQTVTFTDASTGTAPLTYAWDFGDGSTSADQNPTHVYTTAGSYTVALTVTNPKGTDTMTKTGYITVIKAVSLLVNFTADPTTGVTPLSVRFTDESTNTPSSWAWDFGDGSTSTVQNPVHVYTSSGTYTVTLTATNTGGSNSLTKNGLVNAQATSGPVSGSSNTYVRAANHDGIRWDETGNGTYYIPSGSGGLSEIHISNDPSVTGGQVTVTKNQAGTFYVTGDYQDEIVLLLAVNGTIPDDFSARITTSGYTWTPTGSLPASGNYTYQSSALDQTFTRSDFFYGPQNWKPTPASPDYPLFSGEDMTSTVNRYQLMFIDTRAGLLNNNSLTNNGAVRIDYNLTSLPDNAHFNIYGWKTMSGMGRTNALTGTGSSGYTVVSPNITITPVANFTASQTEGLAPFMVRFQDESLNTPTSWLWDFGDSYTSTSRNATHTYNSSGTYTVRLTATNSKGPGTRARAGYVTVSNPVDTPFTFNLPGISTRMNGTSQEIIIAIANSTRTGNLVNVTTGTGAWDFAEVTLTDTPVSDGTNWTGTVSSVRMMTHEFVVPISSLGSPNGTLILYLSRFPNATALIASRISSDPPVSVQESFNTAATRAGKQINATAYTVNFTKTDLENAASGGIIWSATITMGVNNSWVTRNGGTSRIVVMHRSDTGTTTIFTPTSAGTDTRGNDRFTAFSPTGLSIFVLTAVSPPPASSTVITSDSSGSYHVISTTPPPYTFATPTTAITTEPPATATPAPAATPKLKVRITTYPTTAEPDARPEATEPVPVRAGSVLWNNPLVLAAEAAAAITLVSVSIVTHLKRRRRRLDPLRWDGKQP